MCEQEVVRFLTVEEVLVLHRIAIEDSGGDPTLRDRGLLESAVATPRQQFGGNRLHEGIPGIAAAYAFHICRNHPFIDGNKRASLAALIAVLIKNDWQFDAAEADTEATIHSVASGQYSKDEFTEWVRMNCHAKPRLDLREFFRSLNYSELSKHFSAIAANSTLAETQATVKEAARAIPATISAWRGAEMAADAGDQTSAQILRQHAILLTALYRAAEDGGYEW